MMIDPEENTPQENIENDSKILPAENKEIPLIPIEIEKIEESQEIEQEKKSTVFFPDYSFREVCKKRKYQTEDQLIDAINEYFNIYNGVTALKDSNGNNLRDKFGNVITHTKPPTVAGLCLHLGFMDRASIYDYISRQDQYSNIIKSALLTIEQFAESMLYTGKPVGAIFWLKNHKWTDQQQIDVKSSSFEKWLQDNYEGKKPEEIEEAKQIN